MMEYGIYTFSVLAVVSFFIGVAHRLLLEKELKSKHPKSSHLNRLESLEISYYMISLLFLLITGFTAGFKLW